jgi:hypothetical protein
VDRVEGEQDRDVQPRLLDGHVLEVVDLHRVGQAEHAAHAGLGVGVRHLPVGEQLHLLELLVDRHLRDEIVDALLHRRVGGGTGGRQSGLVARLRAGVDAAGHHRAEGQDRCRDGDPSAGLAHGALLSHALATLRNAWLAAASLRLHDTAVNTGQTARTRENTRVSRGSCRVRRARSVCARGPRCAESSR